MGKYTEIRCWDFPPKVTINQAFMATGELWGETTVLGTTIMVGLGNKKVKAYYNGKYFGEAITDTYGEFSITGVIGQLGSYKMYSKFEGDTEYNACQSPSWGIEVVSAEVPVKKSTSIDIKASALADLIPTTVKIEGRLFETATGNGIPNREVEIYRGSFLLRKIKTNSNGKFTYSHTLEEAGKQLYWAIFKGDDQYYGCTSTYAEVEVKKVLKTEILYFKAEPYEGYEPLKVIVSGKLVDENWFSVSNKPIEIFRNGISLKTVTTNGDGKFSYQDTLMAGTHSYQAKFKGDNYYKSCESGIVKCYVKTQEGTVPPPDQPPVGKLYALRCYYYNIAGLSGSHIQGAVESIVVPLVNPIITPLGYDYVEVDAFTGYAPQWQAGYYDIIYRARGSPAIPLAVIKPIILAVIAGIVIFWLAWVYLETNRMEYELKMSLDDLLREGYITKEQWEKLREKETEDWWDRLMGWLPMLLLVLLIASIAGALRGRGD